MLIELGDGVELGWDIAHLQFGVHVEVPPWEIAFVVEVWPENKRAVHDDATDIAEFFVQCVHCGKGLRIYDCHSSFKNEG